MIRTAQSIEEVRVLRSGLAEPVGFVPTMGFLHEGHLSLVQMARKENASVVVSIFVNPTQFAPNEDLETYPRDLDRDLSLLEPEGVDVVFVPAADDMYSPDDSTWVQVEGISSRLEGASRPTHFRGVATVVTKLLNIAQPQRVYFGQKDAQQAVVLQRMIRDLAFPIDVRIGSTVREADGLAMSSRNTYLHPKERAAAPILYQALKRAEALWADGIRDPQALRRIVEETLATEPLAKPDYVSVADANTLEELKAPASQALVSLAVRFGATRLIDNVLLGRKEAAV